MADSAMDTRTNATNSEQTPNPTPQNDDTTTTTTTTRLSIYMGWATHSVRLIPRFTNTLLACCGRKYRDVYYEQERDELDAYARKKVRARGLCVCGLGA